MTEPNEQTHAQDVAYQIFNELAVARDAWSQYLFLYADPRKSEILQGCAPWFFAVVRTLLIREVVLAISRLTDPASSPGGENLSIRRLLQDPAIDSHGALRDRLTSAVLVAEAAASPIRPHRNKVIAHSDLGTSLARSEVALPGLNDSIISSALTALEEVSRLHAHEVLGSHLDFELSAMGGAETLIEVLESSERWQRLMFLRGQSD